MFKIRTQNKKNINSLSLSLHMYGEKVNQALLHCSSVHNERLSILSGCKWPVWDCRMTRALEPIHTQLSGSSKNVLAIRYEF